MISLKFIIGSLIFILSIHILATIYYWYWTYSWFDIPMHFFGGFWVAMVFLYLINPKLPITNYQLPITLILTLSFVALIGVFWEFFEFFYDILISSRGYSGFMQLGAADSLGDLFFDLLGGSVFFVIYKIFRKLGGT